MARKRERRGWTFTLCAVVLKPTLFRATTHEWEGGEHIPAEGGCVIALNHLTKIDPLFAAHFLYEQGRMTRYLAKDSLFEVPVLGGFLRAAGQIPVARESSGLGAFSAAVEAVRDGKCVVVYPEGTITRDPDLWPMTGKTGAARLAIETGCPVIPVAHWGAQEVLAPYASKPDLFPRKKIRVKAGPALDLTDLATDTGRASAAAAATGSGRIMDAITDLLADIRGETPPTERFDPRKRGVSEFGNPHQQVRDDEGDQA